MSINKVYICDLCSNPFEEENGVGVKRFNDQIIICYPSAGDKHVCGDCLQKLKKVDFVKPKSIDK